MDENVRVVTELRLRRESKGLDRSMLVSHLQLRCQRAEGLDARTIRDWENRGHTPSAFYQAVLCSYFDVDSIAELGLGDTPEAARHWTWATPDEKTRDVQRRQFCHLASAGVAGLLLPVAPLTAAAQLLGGRRRLDAAGVDTVQDAATHLASRYVTTPDREAIAAAQAHAYTLQDVLRRAVMAPGTRARLAAVASDAAMLAGYGHVNAGRFAQADGWFAAALRLAREAGNRQLEAFALAAHALTPRRAGLEPDRDAALAALEAAAELHLFLLPAGQAALFGNLALEHAALGDDLGSGRLLERARIAAAKVPSGEPGWGLLSIEGGPCRLGGPRVDVFAGVRSLRLGRPAEAVGLLEGALDGTVEPIRRAYLYEDLTHAWVALGDPDRACASAVAALDEAKTHELEVFRTQIRKARRTFPASWRRQAAVIELDERLRLAA